MSELLEKAEKFAARVLKEQEAQTEIYKKEFLSLCRELFDHPEMKSFSWGQADSGWNDGDASYLRVGDVTVNGINECEEVEDDTDVEYDEEGDVVIPAWLDKKISEIEQFLYKMDNDLLEDMFGEATIIITRDGVKLEDAPDRY